MRLSAATPTSDRVVAAFRQRLRAHPPRRLLALCREHVGDLVNTTPALLALRRAFPGAEIVVECGASAVGVLENFPAVDEVWPRPTHQGAIGKARAIGRMRRGGFDLAVVLDDSHDLMLHARLAGIPLRVGVWRGRKFGWCYTAAVAFASHGHELRDNLRSLLDLLEAPMGDPRPALFPDAADRQAAETALAEVGLGSARLAVIHPGASDVRRQWPPELWAATAKALRSMDITPLLVAGPREHDLTAEIRAFDSQLPSVGRQLSILQLAALFGRCAVVLCGDTGPMHVAAAMRTPVVALFGPSDPERDGPFGEEHVCLQGACSCAVRSVATCTKTCLRSIRPEEVARAAAKAARMPERTP